MKKTTCFLLILSAVICPLVKIQQRIQAGLPFWISDTDTFLTLYTEEDEPSCENEAKEIAQTMDELKGKSALFHSYSSYSVFDGDCYLHMKNLLSIMPQGTSEIEKWKIMITNILRAVKELVVNGQGYYLSDISEHSFLVDRRTKKVFISGFGLTKDPRKIKCEKFIDADIVQSHGCAIFKVLKSFTYLNEPLDLTSEEERQMIENVQVKGEGVVALLDHLIEKYKWDLFNFAEKNNLVGSKEYFSSNKNSKVLTFSQDEHAVRIQLNSNIQRTFVIQESEIDGVSHFLVCHKGSNCVNVRELPSPEVFLPALPREKTYFANIKIEKSKFMIATESTVYINILELDSNFLAKKISHEINVVSAKSYFLAIRKDQDKIDLITDSDKKKLELPGSYQMLSTPINGKVFYDMDIYGEFDPAVKGENDGLGVEKKFITGNAKPRWYLLTAQKNVAGYGTMEVNNPTDLEYFQHKSNLVQGRSQPVPILTEPTKRGIVVFLDQVPIQLRFISPDETFQVKFLKATAVRFLDESNQVISPQFLRETDQLDRPVYREYYDLEGSEGAFVGQSTYVQKDYHSGQTYFTSMQQRFNDQIFGGYYEFTIKKFPFARLYANTQTIQVKRSAVYFTVVKDKLNPTRTPPKLTVFICLTAKDEPFCHIIMKDVDLKSFTDSVALELPAFVEKQNIGLSQIADLYLLRDDVMVTGLKVTDREQAYECFVDASLGIYINRKLGFECNPPGPFSKRQKLSALSNDCKDVSRPEFMSQFCTKAII